MEVKIMQVQNPQYQYYKKLAGTWLNADGSCEVKLGTTANIEIKYGEAHMSKNYFVHEGINLMMGMAVNNYQPNPGEELRINVPDAKLIKGDKVFYQVNSIWYGSETINMDMTDLSNGMVQRIALKRDGIGFTTDSTPATYKCECGQSFTSKFCPNCGLPRKEEKTFTCECGYTGLALKFCPNCGKAIEEEITCECGYKCKGVKFCPNCGKPVAAINIGVPAFSASVPAFGLESPKEPAKQEIKLGWKCPSCGAENQEGKCTVCGKEFEPVVLFSVSTYQSTNPPVTTYATVYEYSDTQLLYDCNGKRRLISVDVIEPAREIIRKNRLDDPDFKDKSAAAIMGGSVYVGFKDGDKYVQTSLQEQGYAVTTAQSQLMGLFNNA